MEDNKAKTQVKINKIKLNERVPKNSYRYQKFDSVEKYNCQKQISLSFEEQQIQKVQSTVKQKYNLTKLKRIDSIKNNYNHEKKSETTNDKSKIELNEQLLQILAQQNKNLKEQNKLLYQRVKLLEKRLKDSLQQRKIQISNLIKQKQLLEQNILDFSELIKYKLEPYTQKLMSYIYQIQQQNTRFLNIINLSIINSENKQKSQLSIEQKIEYLNKNQQIFSVNHTNYDKQLIILGINTNRCLNSADQRLCLTQKQSLNS